MTKKFDKTLFARLPVVGILRGFSSDQIAKIVPAAAEGGLTNIEITMNSDAAVQLIDQVCNLVGETMNVGAGTVCTLSELDAAIAAGASFIVTPVVVPEVIESCVERGVPVFPGATTPTEIYQAWQFGATMVKVFPAGDLGPAYIKNVKAPLSQISLMPTGGISVENLPDYKAAGADAFGVGTPLFDAQRISAKDWDWIRTQAERFAAAYQRAVMP